MVINIAATCANTNIHNLCSSGHIQEDVDHAESLCKDLVEHVKREYDDWKSRPPPPPQESYGHRSYSGRSVSTASRTYTESQN
jgi:hypothetical protein